METEKLGEQELLNTLKKFVADIMEKQKVFNSAKPQEGIKPAPIKLRDIAEIHSIGYVYLNINDYKIVMITGINAVFKNGYYTIEYTVENMFSPLDGLKQIKYHDFNYIDPLETLFSNYDEDKILEVFNALSENKRSRFLESIQNYLESIETYPNKKNLCGDDIRNIRETKIQLFQLLLIEALKSIRVIPYTIPYPKEMEDFNL